MSASTRPRGDPALAEESAEELYEQAPCGYLSTLPDGAIVRLNQTFAAWTGRPRHDLLERCRFQDLLTVPGRIYYETHWAPLLRMQGFISEIAFELQAGDRSPIPILVSAVQKRDASGEPLLTRITVFNATERRRYERELLLERRRAERADRAKADLLAMIGHDMRSPLSAIATAVQLLEREPPVDRRDRCMRVLRSSSSALLALANQILEYSRLEAGQVVVAAAPFEPAALIREAADSLLGQAEQKGIALETEIDSRVPPVLWGDAGKIRQVLSNLGGNAVKFTERGGVTLSMRALEIDGDQATIEIAVRDTGIGISPDRLEAVFEEFTQASPEIGKSYGGTGLGLTISRRLAEMLHGALSAESEPGKGSRFRFRLPLRVPEPPAR